MKRVGGMRLFERANLQCTARLSAAKTHSLPGHGLQMRLGAAAWGRRGTAPRWAGPSLPVSYARRAGVEMSAN